jgi:hypothetical protein
MIIYIEMVSVPRFSSGTGSYPTRGVKARGVTSGDSYGPLHIF